MPHVTIWFSGLLASCVLMVSTAFAQEFAPITPETPKPAPAAVYKDEKGDVYALNPQENKLTAVHFWATWCVPCIKELSEVDTALATYGSKGFKVVAISLDADDGIPKVKQFFADHKITRLTPYVDFGMASFKASGTNGLPTTIFINAQGQEIARAEGPLAWQKPETITFLESNLK